MIAGNDPAYSRVDQKGRVQIPASIRAKLHLDEGDFLLWADVGLEKVVVMKGALKEVTGERPR